MRTNLISRITLFSILYLALAAGILEKHGIARAADLSAVRVAVSDGIFAHPHDLILSRDGRFLYIADNGNDAIKVLDPNTLKTLGAFGQSQLSRPHDVTLDGDGRLLVADSGNNRIAIFEIAGTMGRFIGEFSGGMASPEGVAWADGLVYVTNVGNGDLVVIKDGKEIRKTGSHGSAVGQFNRPHDVHVDGRGRILIADPGNNRVQILDQTLKVTSVLHGPPYLFQEPKYLTVDSLGRLFVADEYSNLIKVIDRKGALVMTIGESDKEDEKLNQPEGVEVRGGSIWISDTYNNRILLYRLPGT
ncbi:MAG: NHL repeat-containing protein [Rhodospirillales bacterium]|nr:NHL repeat-containing protein [Rhodospirillales bacterium]